MLFALIVVGIQGSLTKELNLNFSLEKTDGTHNNHAYESIVYCRKRIACSNSIKMRVSIKTKCWLLAGDPESPGPGSSCQPTNVCAEHLRQGFQNRVLAWVSYLDWSYTHIFST